MRIQKTTPARSEAAVSDQPIVRHQIGSGASHVPVHLQPLTDRLPQPAAPVADPTPAQVAQDLFARGQQSHAKAYAHEQSGEWPEARQAYAQAHENWSDAAKMFHHLGDIRQSWFCHKLALDSNEQFHQI